MSSAPIVVTGVAGFIGFHLTKRLLQDGHKVVGVDSLTSYYSTKLKEDRLAQITDQQFQFLHLDLADQDAVFSCFDQAKPNTVVHLAAQAGVRYSIENPAAYMDSNMTGFFHILEACRQHQIEHLVYASSSSVYGAS
ncbi:MAG TPA: hypothetical protein DIT62_05755, partial [Alphaproteobacteria bacterium]|nr:hypothetical protein [Alphaproteobacteria bacterium]